MVDRHRSRRRTNTKTCQRKKKTRDCSSFSCGEGTCCTSAVPRWTILCSRGGKDEIPNTAVVKKTYIHSRYLVGFLCVQLKTKSFSPLHTPAEHWSRMSWASRPPTTSTRPARGPRCRPRLPPRWPTCETPGARRRTANAATPVAGREEGWRSGGRGEEREMMYCMRAAVKAALTAAAAPRKRQRGAGGRSMPRGKVHTAVEVEQTRGDISASQEQKGRVVA